MTSTWAVSLLAGDKMNDQSKVLMVEPTYFRIEEGINPFMHEANGTLKISDLNLAVSQWTDLKAAYEKIGIQVEVLAAKETLPDMVFAANQSFVYLDHKTNEKSVIISHMRHDIRQPETKIFESWYKANNYNIHRIPPSFSKYFFEGNGDALPIVSRKLILGGFGPRTSPEIYRFIEDLTQYKVLPLNPQNPKFYHLDTCLSILDDQTIACVREVFTHDELTLLDNNFKNIIEISPVEAETNFAANCHCPDGKNVLLQKGSKKFCKDLTDNGFNCIEVDTSEFMKSGGSVFCMKMTV